MSDTQIARNKPSMQITDGELVSWGTVKGTILNYLRRYIAGASPNAYKMLSKIENEYSLSGQHQSDLFQYKNNVSGLINYITRKSEDWPSSSVFSYIKGNKVVLITLAGVIEYDKNDIKKTKDGDVYINNAKAHFFNGTEANVSICPKMKDNEQILTYEDIEECNFTCNDISLFPAISTHTKVISIDDITRTTTYEIMNKNLNNGHKCWLSINSNDGIPFSNLDDDNVVPGSLSYDNERLKENIEVCNGNFANFMPYKQTSVIYHEIDGDKNSQVFTSDGCCGICKEDSSSMNANYIVNNFVNLMSDNYSMDDARISEVGEKFRLMIHNINQANIAENEHDNKTGERYVIINTTSPMTDGYCHSQVLFNGKYVDQIINYDENGNYLIATKNLKNNTSNDVYEVQLGNGELFVGKLKFNDEVGEVYFMEGKFINRDGKVLDNKKQISLQEASSLSFDNARSINDNDIKEFASSDRILIEEGENGYDFTIIGTSFENTIKNNKKYSEYLPSLDYIDKQIYDVEEFIKSEMQALSNHPQRTYDEYIKEINAKGFSESLIKKIRKATKELYTKTKTNTYTLSDGKKITNNRLSAFYSQLSQWQYLHRMRNKKKEISDDDVNENKTENINDEEKNNNNSQKQHPDEINEKSDTQHEKQDETKTNDTKQEQQTEMENTPSPINKNLLTQQQSNNNNTVRYPEILNHKDLTAILNDPEANELSGLDENNKAIFSQITNNVKQAEDEKIKSFIQVCKILHESRGELCDKNGAKILPLSQAEYEQFMHLNNLLTTSFKKARDPKLPKLLQSYHIEIIDEYNDIKDDFNKAMNFGLSAEHTISNALHTQNCELFDNLDKNGEIKQCCNDILFERDVNGEDIKANSAGYYNEFEEQDSLNTNASLYLPSTMCESIDCNII